MTSAHEKRSSGFTLIELVVVLCIVAILLAMATKIGGGLQAAALRSGTDKKLTELDSAIANFVMVNRRLPCPADGALPSSDPLAGREKRTAGTCDNNQARGVAPWVTLGVPEFEATDAYGNRITYRVAPALVGDEAMNFTACDPAGAAGLDGATSSGCKPCTSGAVGAPASCTLSSLAFAGKGLEIRKVGMGAGDVIASPASSTGAAYLLMSHGENHGGAYGPSGAVQGATEPNGGAEDQNAATNALQAFYVDDSTTATPHFDDLMVRQPVIGLATRAALAPRLHQPCPNPAGGTCPAI
jgi:prepilin-type N-terminal cleavage/methylation domain-containing protein